MSKGYEIIQLNSNQSPEVIEINPVCPNGSCPNGWCASIVAFCDGIPIGICTCPPPPPDSGCPLEICGPEIAKNPGNR
ncbi:hypothetical protein [Clostridium tetani]|uniref:hypothetical protein n=1 Tax=Clostridium tetani TaxID=1513 RepID=UPI0005144CD4|nr:hypothetical protein [Clostridium tetani]KGI36861.1 hypothetical protein LA33_12080 [Clostridium tetani ATCC 9441]SUY82429.1 Uncharacterised protein [Clostridium tetani]